MDTPFLNTLYQLVCITLAISIVTYNIILYSHDEDLTEVSYKFYNQEDESIYPSITICVDDPFKSKELGAYGVNKTNYENFF